MASGIKEYDVELDGVVLTPPVTAPTVSKAISGLTAGTEHDVRVRARDNAGNVSAWSAPITSIRTPGGHRRYRETEIRALLAGTPAASTS